jgi:hypothetical protein
MKLSALLLAAAVAGACEASKSETPTSPSVAGPIAGVAITAPSLRSPVNGAEVVNTEPLRLVFGNASSNGVRPLHYLVEVATDRDFAQRAYFNPKVLPFDGEQTSVVVDTKLDAERTYYWRVKADDGANSSEYSTVANFDLVVPVVISAPEAVSPGGGAAVTSRTPELRVNNGRVQGRAGEVHVHFIVATDASFSNVVFHGSMPSGVGGTAISTAELPANTTLFWRSWATNGVTSSGFSNSLSFRTPAAPAPPPSGGGGGGGGGLPPNPGGGARTPDPPPGQALPLPGYGEAVVFEVARQFPGALRNSCQEAGGSWEFMDRVVDALRQYDTRWGYNWKRAHVGDPSLDAINYHFGRGASEGSRDVYTIDIIIGHCGPNPGPAWINLTDPNGAGAMWTGRGRF